MLDERLKSIARQELPEAIKKGQIQYLTAKRTSQQKRKKWVYVSTCLVFTLLLLFFVQTLDGTPPVAEQSAAILTVGELEQVTYLFSTRPERMYHLQSPFYTNKLTMKDEVMLRNLKAILQQVELKPFEEELTAYSTATNYLIEQKNGETLYLKWLSGGAATRVIIPDMMLELMLSENDLIEFEKQWLLLYLEESQYATWQIILIVLLIVAVIGEAIYRKRSLQQETKNSPLLNLLVAAVTVGLFLFITRWLGTAHALIIFGIVTFCSFLFEGLQLFLKKKEVNWPRFINELVRIYLITLLLLLI